MRTSNITREQALALANELGYAVTKSRSIRWKRSFSRRTSLPD